MFTELSPWARGYRFRSCPEAVASRVHEERRAKRGPAPCRSRRFTHMAGRAHGPAIRPGSRRRWASTPPHVSAGADSPGCHCGSGIRRGSRMSGWRSETGASGLLMAGGAGFALLRAWADWRLAGLPPWLGARGGSSRAATRAAVRPARAGRVTSSAWRAARRREEDCSASATSFRAALSIAAARSTRTGSGTASLRTACSTGPGCRRPAASFRSGSVLPEPPGGCRPGGACCCPLRERSLPWLPRASGLACAG